MVFWFRVRVRVRVVYECTHLLPEVESPGNVSVGVVLLIGALMKLRLDGLCLNRKLSRYCNK